MLVFFHTSWKDGIFIGIIGVSINLADSFTSRHFHWPSWCFQQPGWQFHKSAFSLAKLVFSSTLPTVLQVGIFIGQVGVFINLADSFESRHFQWPSWCFHQPVWQFRNSAFSFYDVICYKVGIFILLLRMVHYDKNFKYQFVSRHLGTMLRNLIDAVLALK